ncbi:hypothetical protein ACP70R_045150 [Stipagrostis hirtigluma subsp. patula]
MSRWPAAGDQMMPPPLWPLPPQVEDVSLTYLPIIRPSRPEDCQTVVALPLQYRPLFPRFQAHFPVQGNPRLFRVLLECYKSPSPYVGLFLVNDKDGTDPNPSTRSDSEKSSSHPNGNETLKGLHHIGTLAEIIYIGREYLLLHGCQRVQITGMVAKDPLEVKVEYLEDKHYDKDDEAIKATYGDIMKTLSNFVGTSNLEAYTQLMGDSNYSVLADFGAMKIHANKLHLQKVLEELDIYNRLKLTLELVKNQLEQQQRAKEELERMRERAKEEFERMKEQMSAQNEESDNSVFEEEPTREALLEKFEERIKAIKDKCPRNVLHVMKQQLSKLRLMIGRPSDEFVRTYDYLDLLTVLPWGDYSDENCDVSHAQKILDEHHYGQDVVKERILEFIAVRQLNGRTQGSIICLLGPPGVGKTSIARSIAEALNRKFYKFSVGGLEYVEEIKGMPRGFLGALPGKIVQCLKSVGTANPLILIDEIDKVGPGHAGNAASALLEVLDPDQNYAFADYYLDVPIDLSKVLFVCTANSIEGISGPLRDRMEIIAISGYTNDEKMHIARQYLEKKIQEATGVKSEQVEVQNAALFSLIENYCPEAGVRNLQRHTEKIYRKVALKVARQKGSFVITDEPSRDTAVVEASKETTNVDSTTEVEDVKPKDTPGEDSSADVKPTDSSPKKTGVDTATKSQLGYNESNEGSIEETTRTMDPSSKPQANGESTHRTTEALVGKGVEKVVVDASNLVDFVGEPDLEAGHERLYDETPVGVVMALAWNGTRGLISYIEAAKIEDQGKGVLVTGQIGDVMNESALIAVTVAKAILLQKEPNNPFFAKSALHLHVNVGDTLKDGPSAGCTMVASMLSLAIGKSVKKDLAMTGEVTLTGRILRVGKVKEKIIAAKRAGAKIIILPSANRREAEKLPSDEVEGLEVHFVDKCSEIYDIAFPSDDPTPGHDSAEGILRSLSPARQGTKCWSVNCGWFRG